MQVTKKILDETKRPAVDRPAIKERPTAKPPGGLGHRSLLRAANFRRATADVLAKGRVVEISKRWNAKAAITSSEPATGAEALISFARLETAAPQRIAASTERSRDIDYLVLQNVVGLQWRAFLKDGKRQVTASPDGRRMQ